MTWYVIEAQCDGDDDWVVLHECDDREDAEQFYRAERDQFGDFNRFRLVAITSEIIEEGRRDDAVCG